MWCLVCVVARWIPKTRERKNEKEFENHLKNENYLLKISKNCRFYYTPCIYMRISRRHVFTLWSSYIIIIIIIVHAGADVKKKNVRFHCRRHGVASNANDDKGKQF